MNENRQLFGLEDLRGKLSERGYKMTPQRKEILQIFVEHSDYHHMSAEDVYKILREKDSEIGLATVYRALDLLNWAFSLKSNSATAAPATNLTPPTRKFIIIII